MDTRMIGNKIAEARKKLNVSQAQLAQRLFISAQAVGKWERGESMPDIITLNRLAEILDVDLNFFSENFFSDADELVSNENSVKQQEDIQPGEQRKKRGWDMSRGNWVGADFSGLKNLHEKFSSSNMQNCKFINSDLSGLLLKGNNIDRCDFTHSNISGSHIQGCDVARNIFIDCSLKETEFSGSDINSNDLSGTDLTEVKFKFCDFAKNTITNTVWSRTSFIGTHLFNLVFNGTIDDCYFENSSFRKVTFQNATLMNTFFKCGSLKKIKFIDCQADRMTYEFLKNGKADLTGITLIAK